MTSEEKVRVGARSIAEIPRSVRIALQKGECESVNLVEWLSVDQVKLAETVFKQLGHTVYLSHLQPLKSESRTAMQGTLVIGERLASLAKKEKRDFLEPFILHTSDSVRSWACVASALLESTPKGKLKAVKRFAKDPHMGVREISWMVVRSAIEADLDGALPLLVVWAQDKDANVRRFASESTRPRGVWTKHIAKLKQEPMRGLPILELLRSDTSKYVRDSVGNWLNDAAKSKPTWVRTVCARWRRESKTQETDYIIRRALRTVDK